MSDANTEALFQPLQPAQLEWRDEEPFASAFEDHYFSREDGLAESRYVFIDGNRLVERCQQLRPGATLVVAETGFGTGLNFLVCWATFVEHAPATSRLHFISVEKHPLQPADLARALRRWPSLAPQANALQQAYPALTPGFHRRRFADGRVALTLMLGDAQAMLSQLEARVDAWFLDGFAPARNEEMWHDGVFQQLARLSHSGTSLATFTASGSVRRALNTCGFVMRRAPGHGRKREMLIGEWKPDQGIVPMPPVPSSVAIIGAGLAGCTLAAALAERGIATVLYDGNGVASGASGNLAGVVYTSASAHPTSQNRFYQSSYLFTLALLQRLDFPRDDTDGRLSGVLQLPKNAAAALKAQQAAQSGLWPISSLSAADQAGALMLHGGGYLSPPRWCAFLLDHYQHQLAVHAEHVEALCKTDRGWRLTCASGAVHNHQQVILCNAAAATTLLDLPWLKLKSIRGQVSYVASTEHSRRWTQAICHGGYLTPPVDGLHCVGATFDQDDNCPAARDTDNLRNLQQLQQYLPEHWQQLGGDNIRVESERVGFRCQSTDFLPLAGHLGDIDQALTGLWLNIAHGSRGITGTALCAEVIASDLCAEPSPVDRAMHAALAPARFIRRQQKQRPRRRSG